MPEPAAFAEVSRYFGDQAVHLDPAGLTVGVPTDGSAAEVRALLDAADPGRVLIAGFAVRGVTLDDVFLTLTGHDKETASNALTMAGRSLRLSARSPEALLTALMLPVMLMVVFVYLFGGAVDIGTRYVDYVVPGVLLLCAVTGASTTAVTVCQDMAGGIIDRFRSLDVSGPAVLGGHVTASLLRNLVSTVLVTAVAFGIGFRPHASVASFAAALGILLLFVAAVSWLAAALGLPGAGAGGGQLGDVLPDVLLLRQQRVGAGPDHAVVAARVRAASAGGPRRSPRPSAACCSATPAAGCRWGPRWPGAAASWSRRWPCRCGCSGVGRYDGPG